MRCILYMYLAGLIWLLEILMFASIILIPLVIYLRFQYRFFEKPFEEAYFKI